MTVSNSKVHDDQGSDRGPVNTEQIALQAATRLAGNEELQAKLVWPLLESENGKRRVALLGLQGTALYLKVVIVAILGALGWSYTVLWSKTTTAITQGIEVLEGLQNAGQRMNAIVAQLDKAEERVGHVDARIHDASQRLADMNTLAIDQARIAAADKTQALFQRYRDSFDERVDRIETRLISNQNLLASDTRAALADFGAQSAELQLEIAQAQRADEEFKSILNATVGSIGSTTVGYARAKHSLWLERERISITINKLAGAGASGIDVANHQGSVIARIADQPYGRPLHVSEGSRCIALSISSPAGLRRRSIVVAHSYLRSVGKQCGDASYFASEAAVVRSEDGDETPAFARNDPAD